MPTLQEGDPQLELWIVYLISLSVIIVLTTAICITVVVIKNKFKRRKRYVHQTKPRQGSQRSVYSIRSHDTVALTNSQYEYVDVLGDDSNETESSLEDRTTRTVIHIQQGDSNVYDQLESQKGEELISSSGATRVAVPPFISVDHQEATTQQGTRESDINIHKNSNQQAEVTCIVETGLDAETSPGTAEALSIQIIQNNQTEDPTAFEDGTLLRNIPEFEDPEVDESLEVPSLPNIYSSQILVTVDDVLYDTVDEGETVLLNRAIQSESSYHDRHTPGPLIPSNQKPERIHFSEPEYEDVSHCQPTNCNEGVYNTAQRLAPEGAQFNQSDSIEREHQSRDRSDLKENVVYDEPVVKTKHGDEDRKSTNENLNLKNLFDDPSYTQGLMRMVEAEQSQSKAEPIRKRSRTMDTPTRPEILTFEQPIAPQSMLQSPMSLSSQHHSNEEDQKYRRRYSKDDTSLQDRLMSPKIKPESNIQPLALQMTQPSMRSSIDSLELLDYQPEEIEELDPEIAMCLQQPDKSFGGMKVTEV